MNKAITITKIKLGAKNRIRLDFDKTNIPEEEIRLLPGATFSKNLNTWHIAYNKEQYAALTNLGYEIVVIKDAPTQMNHNQNDNNGKEQKRNYSTDSTDNAPALSITDINKSGVKIEIHNKNFWVKFPFSGDKVDFMKTLEKSWWHKNYHNWVTKATIPNLEALQDEFQYWTANDYKKIYDIVALMDDPLILELYRTPDNIKRIWVQVRGYKMDTDFFQQIPQQYFDENFKRWSIPNKEPIIRQIINHYQKKGAKIINRLPEKGEHFYKKAGKSPEEKQKILFKKHPYKFRSMIEKTSNVMITQRYSWRTINSYIDKLVGFGHYAVANDIKKVNSDIINDYLTKIAKRKVSDSTLNVTVSALKFYYQKVVFRPDIKIDQVKRPRKSITLPHVLSKQEIELILSALDNIKHVTILYTLYSSGLRLNELLHLRVEDISFDRDQIFVRKGKGRKDRVIMLSDTLKEILALYTTKYQPVYWLFEGQNKHNQYSAKSVQNIVKKAAIKAGIAKTVTPHKIRHCFATHLLDEGTDLRYIQELLGHKDIKTTLIYTHVTTRNITKIKSPLDNLKLNISKKDDKK